MEWNSQTILTIFVALTGLAVLLQAAVLIGILVALRKATQQSMELVEDMRSNVMPTVQSAAELLVRVAPLVERLTPQIIAVSTNLVEITTELREETAELRRTTSDINMRLQRQASRLDGMLSHGLDRVEALSDLVDVTVSTPARQANGVVMAVKAALETYFGGLFKSRFPRPGRDKDMFI
jgi:hypothetical protein